MTQINAAASRRDLIAAADNAEGRGTMSTMVKTLRDEHRNLLRLLDALEHQINVFERSGGPDYDIILGVADYCLDFPDQRHHPQENAIHQRLAERFPTAAARLNVLLKEHRTAHELAVRFHQCVSVLMNEGDISRASVVDTARAFIAFQRAHIDAEEAALFPLVERLLSAEDWACIEASLAAERDPLFGERVDARFATLSRRLLAWEGESRAAG